MWLGQLLNPEHIILLATNQLLRKIIFKAAYKLSTNEQGARGQEKLSFLTLHWQARWPTQQAVAD
jgi:hypothetical protein